MKKNFKLYVLGWLILFGLFNAIAFLIPAWPTLEKFTASFWIAWGITVAAFLGQLVCARYAFKEESSKKTFYNISLFSVSYTGLITLFVVSMICIIVAIIPFWVPAIACSIVLVANILAVIKAKIAIDIVVGVDEKIEQATAFIYDMREESESLFVRVKSEDFKPLCKKVRDAFKFSDPMSNTGLASVEVEIKDHFEAFSNALSENNADVVTSECEELLALIKERNNKCKRLK